MFDTRAQVSYFCTNNLVSGDANEANISHLTRKACYRIIDNLTPS